MTNNMMQDIINRIRQRRNDLDYSFQELADLTDMSKSTLQRYESGAIKNIPLDKLQVLANALKVSPEWIMGWDVSSDQGEDGVPGTVLSISDRRNEKIVISINKNLDLLNTDGKKMVFDYSELLLKNQRFVSESEHLEVKAAHERTDVKVTDEMRKHDDGVMDDDDF